MVRNPGLQCGVIVGSRRGRQRRIASVSVVPAWLIPVVVVCLPLELSHGVPQFPSMGYLIPRRFAYITADVENQYFIGELYFAKV